jgi:hypothetical protein
MRTISASVRRRRSACGVLAALGLVTAAPAAAAEVRLVGRVDGARLGATRAEALRVLGRPDADLGRWLRYDGRGVTVGLGPRGRVRALTTTRRGACTPRGVCVGARGSAARVRRLYGPSLRLLRWEPAWWGWSFRLRGGGRVVEASFRLSGPPAAAHTRVPAITVALPG